jgi:integrase
MLWQQFAQNQQPTLTREQARAAIDSLRSVKPLWRSGPGDRTNDCIPSAIATVIELLRHTEQSGDFESAGIWRLVAWGREHRRRLPSSLQESQWVFPSKRTGRPSHPWSAQRRWLLRAGEKVGAGRLGWHAFRHTYSSLLNEHGTDVKVQQELLRHADIRTTMNIYTRAVPERLRTANSKLVRLLLPTGTSSRA